MTRDLDIFMSKFNDAEEAALVSMLDFGSTCFSKCVIKGAKRPFEGAVELPNIVMPGYYALVEELSTSSAAILRAYLRLCREGYKLCYLRMDYNNG